MKSFDDGAALVNRALGALCTQLSAGYVRWPTALRGARLYFIVHIDGADHARTIAMDGRPRLYDGLAQPASAHTPFVLARVTLPQLMALLSRPDDAAALVLDGNDARIMHALDACLTR